MHNSLRELLPSARSGCRMQPSGPGTHTLRQPLQGGRVLSAQGCQYVPPRGVGLTAPEMCLLTILKQKSKATASAGPAFSKATGKLSSRAAGAPCLGRRPCHVYLHLHGTSSLSSPFLSLSEDTSVGLRAHPTQDELISRSSTSLHLQTPFSNTVSF